MKGMQKIRRGKGFAGVVLYALKPGSHHRCTPYVIGGNMEGSAAEDLIAEFNSTKELRPDVAKPVWHNSLRLPKNEALTNAQWSEIADDYMKRIGFAETHLRCYVLHDDEDGQHIHIIASRVSLCAGKLYLGKNENLISTRIIQQLERDYSLTRTKGPEASPVSPSPTSLPRKSPTQKPMGAILKPKKLSRNEAMMEKYKGEPSPKSVIQEALETLLAGKPSTTEFVTQLVARNIRVVPNIASTGKMNGFSFEYQGIAFKASQLGKGYSWSPLQSKLDYIPERDNDFLFSLKASVSEALDMTIAIDTPEITTEDVNSPTETLTLNKDAGQDEYAINYPKALLPDANAKEAYATEAVKEAGAGGKEAHATEAVKEAPNRSYAISTFRWLETIPYLNIIIGMLKKLKIPTLKRPGKHNTITGVKVIEITTTPKNTAEIPSIHSNRPPSM
ncbi:relaxase [Pectobacterium parmentieri]|uniref:Relaxase/mobilization nuclease domain-containing protein n=2 Tax=Pectobacterium parmentieri TaxID=1905730 RepID=A0ABS0RUD0_PECPM|nr:relaxase/mobilization nuclease domain-containing protein [Pectobacterium parmentieri]MBI0469326.1 relaxase/mobilization nuclease domain-containing protein [Pectobacterium parmentieri]MBI0491950.1 relaxase/mobilization nuclease domain-containing protein [Pectobacterium parmentieri]MBI0553234.1 relaxase/mobilization nuclease domain-containing protein [Pectobacterium parmentieri]MBI0566369.1 relaxase/mobilization nuclease domain-containing protein [Pectobacterium parmentieri]MBI0571065.1 relax